MDAEQIFKRIRRTIQKFHSLDILAFCLHHLNHQKFTNLEIQKYPPWAILLLIKWTVMYGEHGLSPHRQQFNVTEGNDLLKMLYDLSGAIRPPSQYDNPLLFVRSLAYQQFWWQEDLNLNRLARQSLMFGNLDLNHSFKTTFLVAFGVPIDVFIDLSIGIIAWFMSHNEDFLIPEHIEPLANTYSFNTATTYLDAISRDVFALQKILVSSRRRKGEDITHEYYEESPLKRFPLLKHNNRYYCYSPKLLFESLTTFVYDSLKMLDANQFMGKFGKSVFESYVERSLRYTGLPVLTEQKLKQILGQESRVVDFVVREGNVNLFIDAKGVTLGDLGMVTYLSRDVKRSTKDSIIKGIKQAYETISNLLKHDDAEKYISLGGSNYLIVVTFKDFFLENGRDFERFIDSKSIGEIIQEYGGQELIPVENMYFMPIDDLDLMVECSGNSGGLSNVLQLAIEQDRQLGSIGLMFRRHVYSICPDARFPQFLVDEFDRIQAGIEQRLTD